MRKIEEIEILRAFAILGVVAIHVISVGAYFKIEDHSSYIFIINTVLNIFSHFAVPLFILISGLVLGFKYNGTYSLRDFYKKRMISTIPQYIIFSLLAIVLLYFRKPEVPLSLSSIILRLLTGGAFIHMWFFIVLIQLYILFPFLNKVIHNVDSKKTYIIIFTCLLIQQIIWNTIKLKIMLYPEIGTVKEFFRNTFLTHILYFMLGIFMSKNYEWYKGKLGEIKSTKLITFVLILLALLFFIDIVKVRTFNIFSIMAIYTLNVPLYIGTFILLFNLSSIIIKSKKYLRSLFILLSKYAYGIFLTHLIILIKILDISKGFFEAYYNTWEYYVINFVMTVLLSVILVKLISLLPSGKLMVGLKKSPS